MIEVLMGFSVRFSHLRDRRKKIGQKVGQDF